MGWRSLRLGVGFGEGRVGGGRGPADDDQEDIEDEESDGEIVEDGGLMGVRPELVGRPKEKSGGQQGRLELLLQRRPMNALVQKVDQRDEGKRSCLDEAMRTGRKKLWKEIAGEQKRNAGHGDDPQKDPRRSDGLDRHGCTWRQVIVKAVKKRCGSKESDSRRRRGRYMIWVSECRRDASNPEGRPGRQGQGAADTARRAGDQRAAAGGRARGRVQSARPCSATFRAMSTPRKTRIRAMADMAGLGAATGSAGFSERGG